MPDTALAGLPRLVRVADEVRTRGLSLLALAGAVALYWVLAWLVDEPVDPVVTGLNMAAILVPVLILSLVVSRRRLREGLHAATRPPRLSVHETRADARERRTRLIAFVSVAVVVLLLFDRATDGDGRMAGLMAGLFVGAGLAEWLESRAWHRAETSRGSRLYVLVRPHALMSPFGVTEVYEVVRSDGHDRDRDDIDAPYVI